MLNSSKMLLKYTLANYLYRYPVSSLRTVRLNHYLNAIKQTQHLTRPVLEIGCFLCGTSSIAAKFMSDIKDQREYYAFDTFSGFVDQQFNSDSKFGVNPNLKKGFSENSLKFVSRLLKIWSTEDKIKLIQGDISNYDIADISDSFSLILIDTDLYLPTFKSLKKVEKLIQSDGVILVDDCDEIDQWPGAKKALEDWAEESSIVFSIQNGMGEIHFK